MKVYVAGLNAIGLTTHGRGYAFMSDREKYLRMHEIKHFLESYHYIKKGKTVDRIRKAKERIFLDSGAFSSFTKGVDVDIDAYCAFIQKNEDILDVASVLDAIGDPQGTFENQVYMEKQGVSPLPCFHYGEDERYLEYYVTNYEYITLGGMVPISTPQLYHWLDRIWDHYLTDGSGYPRLQVHGFGLTSQPLMKRYPWYSVDSSSWAQTSAHGGIMLPDWGTLPISRESPAKKQAGQHYTNMPKEFQEAVIKFLNENGWDYDRLTIEGRGRSLFNCWVFTLLEQRYTKESLIFKKAQPELFDI